MKNIFLCKIIAFVFFVLCIVALLSACGKIKIVSIYIDTSDSSFVQTVDQNSVYDTSKVIVKAKLSDKTEITLNNSDCEFQISTKNIGVSQLKATYGNFEAKTLITVKKTLVSIAIKSGVYETYNHKSIITPQGIVLTATYSDGSSDDVTSGITIQSFDTSTVGENKKMTICFGGKTTEKTYTVVRALENIIFVRGGANRIPFSSDISAPYDTSGIVIKATYSDGTETEIAENLSFSNINRTIIGEQDLTITYQGKTCTKKITIFKELSSIAYNSGLASDKKILYNTDINTSDIFVTAYYTDGSSENTAITSFDGYSKGTLGEQDITLNLIYEGKTKSCTIKINVYEELKSITVSAKEGTHANYILIGDSFNTSNFIVTANYSKNSKDVTNFATFSSVNTAEKGTVKCTVSYSDITTKTCTFNVTVIEFLNEIPDITIEKIDIKEGSVKGSVLHNHSIDLSHLIIIVTYSDMSTRELAYKDNATNNYGINIEDLVTSSIGTQNLVINYQGKSCQKSIEITKELISIEISSGSINRLKYGTDLDLTNTEISATYSDSSSEKVTSVNNSASTFNNTVLGDQTMVFSYSYGETTKTYLMKVTVYEELESISLNPTIGSVDFGNTFTTSNIVVTAHYTSLRTAIVSANFENINTNTLETQLLTASYTEENITKTASIPITINDVLLSIKIVNNSINDYCYLGEALDLSTLNVTLNYKSGNNSTIDTSNSDLHYSEISTTTTGNQTLTVEYLGKNDSKTISVLSIPTYTTIGFEMPSNITAYLENAKKQNTYNTTGSTGAKGFGETNKSFMVGSANSFVFKPKVTTSKGGQLDNFNDYKLNICIYMKDSEKQNYTLLENYDDYVVITDNINYDFTDQANGKEFKITVKPYYLTKNEEETLTDAISFEFKVIDGWNAYTAKDISYIDNQNLGLKWNDYWSDGKTDEIEKTSAIATNFNIAKQIKAIILQNDINITNNDIPATHFWQANVAFKGVSLNTGDPAIGTLIDDGSPNNGFIYYRQCAEGETFSIEGNYYTLSTQELAKCVRQDGHTGETLPDEPITVHTTLFALFGKQTSIPDENTTIPYAVYNLNNISLFGNTKKTDQTTMSGGIMMLKTQHCNTFINNNISQGWFISYMFQGDTEYDQDTVMRLSKTNCFDAFNTLLYCWGVNNMIIEDCVMIGAGGPVMICDHVGNNKDTGEGGFQTHVSATNSTLESYVAGTEGWFNIYTGAGAIVGSLKAMDPLLNIYDKSILYDNDTKVNLIAVYKSGSAEGLTNSVIQGTFEKTGNETELDMQSVSSIKNQFITSLMSAGKSQEEIAKACGSTAILQANGTQCIPGDSGWIFAPDAELLANATEILNVYLFNGMGAVVGMK